MASFWARSKQERDVSRHARLLLAAGFPEFIFRADDFKPLRKSFEFRVREAFNMHHFVTSMRNGMDDLVELQVNGARVTVLRVLNEEDHQESDNRGGRVHHELPGVRIMEVRASDAPQNDQ